MEYTLLPAQKEFMIIPHDFPRDIALYQGGFGSGKTFCGSLIGILLCMKYQGITGLVGAQTYTLLRDTTLKQYFEHLDNMGFKAGVHYDYKTSEEILRFKNGSEILFRHLQEPNKLKSLNLGFVELEEMSDTPESTFKMLLSRLRQSIKDDWRKKGFKYRLFGHTNPEASKGWIYKYFVEQKQDNYRLIQAPTTQNTFLEPDYVESLKLAYDEEYYRINVLGEFGDYTSGLVVKGFSNENIKPITYQPDMALHLTWDFNVDPMSCVLAHKTNDKVFYFDEFILENASTEQTIGEVIKRYPNHKGDIIINGDASGDNRSTQSERTNYVIIRNALRRHYPNNNIKLHLRPFNPRIKNRIASFNALVKDYNGNRRLFIDPKCKWVIYNCQNLKYKVGTDEVDVPTYSAIKTDNQLKFLEHPFDAVSYLAEYYFPLRIEDYQKTDFK
jgi:PBSX family phage terminase large subunit